MSTGFGFLLCWFWPGSPWSTAWTMSSRLVSGAPTLNSTQMAAKVIATEMRISIGPMASNAARIGTTNGADGGRYVATWATSPDGSLMTDRTATK